MREGWSVFVFILFDDDGKRGGRRCSDRDCIKNGLKWESCWQENSLLSIGIVPLELVHDSLGLDSSLILYTLSCQLAYASLIKKKKKETLTIHIHNSKISTRNHHALTHDQTQASSTTSHHTNLALK